MSRLRGVVLIGVMLLSSLSRADTPPSKDEQKRQAKSHFKLGVDFYNSGDYDSALREYQAAYAALPIPDILFNIAQVYRLKGNKSVAVDYYKQYLAAEPEGVASAESRMMVATLARDLRVEEETKKELEAAKRRAAEAEAKNQADAAARAAEEARQSEARAEAARQQADLVAVHKKPITKRAWFWPTLVAAAVVVAGGITLGVVLGSSGPSDPSASLGRVPGN